MLNLLADELAKPTGNHQSFLGESEKKSRALRPCQSMLVGIGEEGDTATTFPVGSRTTVPEWTQMGLTSGFDMGPGIAPSLWPCTPSS